MRKARSKWVPSEKVELSFEELEKRYERSIRLLAQYLITCNQEPCERTNGCRCRLCREVRQILHERDCEQPL